MNTGQEMKLCSQPVENGGKLGSLVAASVSILTADVFEHINNKVKQMEGNVQVNASEYYRHELALNPF